MNNKTLRATMYLKRKVMKALQNNPNRITSLSREETLVEVKSEVLSKYSNGFHQIIEDPRSGRVRGHYFQERKILKVYDVIIEPRQAVMYSREGKLIKESISWPSYQFYHFFPWNPRQGLTNLRIDSAVLLSSNPYGHWLLEDLPSVIHILDKYPNAKLVVAENPPKYVADYLRRLDKEIIFLKSPTIIDSLIMIERGEDSGWPHPQDIQVLQNFAKKIIPESHPSESKKIYASRRKSRRSPVNENEIEMLFALNGFEIHCLEDFDFYDEICLISKANYLAGIHGSALSNSVWMSKKSTIYEIVNDSYWTEYGHRLPMVIGHRYIFSTYSGDAKAEVPLNSINEQLKGLI